MIPSQYLIIIIIISKGFVRRCRPWVGINGCHLKGSFGGILLFAVALDGNRGMFLVAITVVEIENRDSRTWFLRLVRETLQSVPEWKDDLLCVMFDQQKVFF